MVHFWSRTTRRHTNHRSRREKSPRRPLLEALEPRWAPAILTGVATPPLTPTQPTLGQAFSNLQFGVVFDDDPAITANNFAVSINWGDGTPVDTTTGNVTAIPGSPATFAVSGSHTFTSLAGDTIPPAGFNVTLTVRDTKNALSTMINSTAFVADATVSQGNPVNAGTPATFFGGGTGQPSAAASLTAFETAVGGQKNTVASPQNGGFRTITWDGVKTDGTDAAAGPNSTTVINTNTVGIPLNRFEGSGVYFGAIYAVNSADAGGNTFTSVNSNVTGLFPPFSPKNTFAMFNDNGIDFKFVSPASTNSTVVPAASRGFGAIFLNVEIPATTTIQYFAGNQLLQTVSAPVGGKGKPVFVGALFANPVVTRVLLTLGTDVIFNFDGQNVTPGPFKDDGVTHNLVVTDDWAYAEPVPVGNQFPFITGPLGKAGAPPAVLATKDVPFTGSVANFNFSNAPTKANFFTATINWGDGHSTNGTIKANPAGGFSVTGSNTYLVSGTFNVSVDVMDFGGGSGFAGSVPITSIANVAKVSGKPSTVGAFDPTSGAWFLNPANAAGAPSPAAFAFGAPGFKPVVGDWMTQGFDTVGVFDPGVVAGDPNTGTWFLRNSNSSGAPDAGKFSYGFAGVTPIVGDWTGTGHVGIGVYDPATATWFLRGTPTAGAPDVGQFQYGMPGWIPVVGDWTGTGKTGIGAYDPTTGFWYLRNTATGGLPDAGSFAYGAAGFQPLTGDWTGTGKTGIGVFSSTTATFLLRTESNAGAPDAGQFQFGLGFWTPFGGTYTQPLAHLMTAGGSAIGGATPLSAKDLQRTVDSALGRLSALGFDPKLLSRLASVQYTIGSLAPEVLGGWSAKTNTVTLSPDAAGYGWFIDPTLGQDVEFASGNALSWSQAAGREDLLTAVLHEMGHVAGQPDSADNTGLMSETLPLGVRRVDGLDTVFSGI